MPSVPSNPPYAPHWQCMYLPANPDLPFLPVPGQHLCHSAGMVKDMPVGGERREGGGLAREPREPESSRCALNKFTPATPAASPPLPRCKSDKVVLYLSPYSE